MSNRDEYLAVIRKMRTAEDGRYHIVCDYVAELEHEIVSLKIGKLGQWTMWHDSVWRLFGQKGQIGSIKWKGGGSYLVGYLGDGYSGGEFQWEIETHYGTEESAKLYVENRLGWNK